MPRRPGCGLIGRKWTTKYGFRYPVTYRRKHLGTFATFEEAEEVLEKAKADYESGQVARLI